MPLRNAGCSSKPMPTLHIPRFGARAYPAQPRPVFPCTCTPLNPRALKPAAPSHAPACVSPSAIWISVRPTCVSPGTAVRVDVRCPQVCRGMLIPHGECSWRHIQQRANKFVWFFDVHVPGGVSCTAAPQCVVSWPVDCPMICCLDPNKKERLILPQSAHDYNKQSRAQRSYCMDCGT